MTTFRFTYTDRNGTTHAEHVEAEKAANAIVTAARLLEEKGEVAGLFEGMDKVQAIWPVKSADSPNRTGTALEQVEALRQQLHEAQLGLEGYRATVKFLRERGDAHRDNAEKWSEQVRQLETDNRRLRTLYSERFTLSLNYLERATKAEDALRAVRQVSRRVLYGGK